MQNILRKDEFISFKFDRLIKNEFDIICKSVDENKRQKKIYSNIIIRLNQTRLNVVFVKCKLYINNND